MLTPEPSPGIPMSTPDDLTSEREESQGKQSAKRGLDFEEEDIQITGNNSSPAKSQKTINELNTDNGIDRILERVDQGLDETYAEAQDETEGWAEIQPQEMEVDQEPSAAV